MSSTTSSPPRTGPDVTLWWCPVCRKTEPDTSQSARYCGSTRDCVNRDGDRMELTAMERWIYVPAGKKAN